MSPDYLPELFWGHCEPTECSIKWSWSWLLSLRFWKSLKNGQIVKMKTILVPVEGKRSARSPRSPSLSKSTNEEPAFLQPPEPLNKIKPFKASPCGPYNAKWSKSNAVMWIRPQSKLEKVSQVRKRLSWSDSEKTKQRHVEMSSSFVIRIQVWAALSVLVPLLQPCQLSFLQHLQLPPPYCCFYSSTRPPTRQDRTTSLRHLRHQFLGLP